MTLTQTEYDSLLSAVEARKPELRKGQALLNAAHNLRPELYKLIVEKCDCFYLDSKFEAAKILLQSKIS